MFYVELAKLESSDKQDSIVEELRSMPPAMLTIFNRHERKESPS